MHIASFAGFAPVNNPVIAVAVIIDSPKGDYYGTAVSAPVFAEVAQKVLEYLGVPHDIDLRPPSAASKSDAPVAEDDTAQNESDIQALYDAANNLPIDDPLRPGSSQTATASQPAGQAANQAPGPAASTSSNTRPASTAAQQASAQQPGTSAQQPTNTVTVTDPARLRVPSLIGLPVRKVIEQAAAADLQVEIVGNGTCRQQAPDPGAMVPPGTKVVVRCGH
jgi:cell division protein FtsI (penicillin-binding protein 3)